MQANHHGKIGNESTNQLYQSHSSTGEPVTLTHQESEHYSEHDESGTVIQHQITTSWFANGVVIRQQTEQDEAPSQQLCAECWISYRVIASPIPITPARKLFHNHCQEQFWLKVQGITPHR